MRKEPINLNEVSQEQLNKIFDKITEDEDLENQLNNIDNNPNFSEEKKILFSEYRIRVAFEKYYDELSKSDVAISESVE